MKKTLIMLTIATLASTSITNYNNSQHSINDKITQLYVLGDSLSDCNNLSNILSSLTWDIHKVKFKKPFYNNSFTNGDTAAEVLAKKLNLTLKSAWDSETIGNNYAVAGARATAASTFGEGFIINRAEIEKQAAKLINEHSIKNTDEIFLEIGGNDIIAALNLKTYIEQQRLIKNAVNNEMKAIQNLINHGANHLLIANAPNISYTPEFNHGDKKELANKLSINFNNFWKNQVTTLMNKNPNTDLKPFNLSNSVKNLLTNAAAIGKNITQSSIQYSHWDLIFNRTPKYINGMTPETINNDFFFDNIHPNKWGHLQLGNIFYNLITKSKK